MRRPPLNILMLSREYPPNVYGGAGVHVDFLSRELAGIDDRRHRIRLLCFGDQELSAGNLSVAGIGSPAGGYPVGNGHGAIIDVLGRNVGMAAAASGADVVHCHTWYTHLAGCVIKQLLNIPLVVTVHSLEPHRPWKREQLGNGYDASSWLEKTALQNADGIVAVSRSMREDVTRLYGVGAEKVRVIHNGIDLARFRKTLNPDVLSSYGVDPARPFVLFVGRITRQKGIIHLVNSLRWLRDGVQVVLCAGAPDTEAIAREMKAAVEQARLSTSNPVVWIREMVPEEKLVVLYSHAALFICPSVYEPFGIINLEAMACETPVVASAVGGIREVVVPGETGLLVACESDGGGGFEPRDPERFARELAGAVNGLMSDPARRRAMGEAARRRVEAHFSWASIARQTADFYQELREHGCLRHRPAAAAGPDGAYPPN